MPRSIPPPFLAKSRQVTSRKKMWHQKKKKKDVASARFGLCSFQTAQPCPARQVPLLQRKKPKCWKQQWALLVSTSYKLQKTCFAPLTGNLGHGLPHQEMGLREPPNSRHHPFCPRNCWSSFHLRFRIFSNANHLCNPEGAPGLEFLGWG